MRNTLGWLCTAASVIAIAGCGTESSLDPNPVPQDPAGEFVSDNPSGTQEGYDDNSPSAGAAGSAGSSSASDAGASEDSKDEASKAIVEADIIQVHGDKLYALSQYGGLAIVDVSNPDDLKMLGRWRVAGMPFEMYLRDGVVYAMYSSFYHLEWDDAAKSAQWVTSSRVVALDVGNPASIQQLATFDIPGEVSDSRMVGDAMYVVSYESNYCWSCSSEPRTTVTSLAVANPNDIHKVDQLAYADGGYSWGRRSISVTQDRIYVAGPEWYDDSNGTHTDHSTIQVVDITDPGGDLVPGASVAVSGQIESRWQMDEYEGVLRVISQPGSWWSGDGAPVVETFQVVTSQQLAPLGQLTMTIPAGERLQSVRFDGFRGYAVTFVQTDPLFTLDLSDPATPKQLGELHMPGFLYHMEPRGNRMIALGRDDGNDAGGLTVSVFDVADINNPTMLSRVNFGSEWGWLPEDQDRIHKAFRIFDSDNLIVVPFAGSSYDSNSCYSYASGVQLIDLFGDQLTARGVVPQHGQARRAIPHNGRLLTVSDDRVASFDIADRDHPKQKSSLAFVHKAYQSKVVGQAVAQISSDWWTDRSTLVISPLADPDRGHPLAEVDLQPLLKKSGDKCDYYYGNGFYDARLFANGTKLYMVWSEGYSYYYDGQNEQPKTAVAVFELADPYHPVLEGLARLDVPMGWSWYYDDYAWGYGWGSGPVSAGKSVVQHGSTIAVLTGMQPYYWYNDPSQPAPIPSVYLIDLSNPATPTVASSFPLPAGTNQTLLQTDGATLLSSHSVPLQSDPSKVKFYLDRFDISNPAQPQSSSPVNVPGSLLSFDHATHRGIFVDYKREILATSDYSECYSQGGRVEDYEYNYDAGTATFTCSRYDHTFRLAQLGNNGAWLLDSLDVDDGKIQSISIGEDRVFVMRGSWSYYYWGDSTQPPPESTLQMISGMTTGDLQASTPLVVDNDPYSWGRVVAISGHKAVLHGDYPPHISVYDSSNPALPQLIKKADTFGYVYNVELAGNQAICSLGPWGLQTVSLGN